MIARIQGLRHRWQAIEEVAMTPFRIAPAALALLAALAAAPARAETTGWTEWSDFYRSFAFDLRTQPDPLADIPQSPRTRTPSHTPEFTNPRGASPGGKGRDDSWAIGPKAPKSAPSAGAGVHPKFKMFKPDGTPVR
jgi:hypothetical protein